LAADFIIAYLLADTELPLDKGNPPSAGSIIKKLKIKM
jgi:hypothetical protein